MTVIALVLLFIVLASFANAALCPPAREPDPPTPRRAPDDEWRVAVHEAGHVVARWYCTTTVDITRVAIGDETGQPDAAGIVTNTHYSGTPEHAWCHAACMLAGLAAELDAFGRTETAGVSADLMAARELLSRLTSKPPWNDNGSGVPAIHEVFVPPLGAGEVKALAAAYRQARRIVRQHRERLLRLAAHLVVRRTLTESDIALVLGSRFMVK